MKLLFKVNKWAKKPCRINAETESIAHEYYEYAVCEQFATIPLRPEWNKRQRVSGALTSLMSSFTKGRRALFPGTKNNWCVYTINGREQSTFSGEIWTLQHYHLLLPLNRAVHFTTSSMTGFRLCSSFNVVFTMKCYTLLYLSIIHVILLLYNVFCISYITSKMFCSTSMCTYVIWCIVCACILTLIILICSTTCIYFRMVIGEH